MLNAPKPDLQNFNVRQYLSCRKVNSWWVHSCVFKTVSLIEKPPCLASLFKIFLSLIKAQQIQLWRHLDDVIMTKSFIFHDTHKICKEARHSAFPIHKTVLKTHEWTYQLLNIRREKFCLKLTFYKTALSALSTIAD